MGGSTLQFVEETVELMKLVQRERVQQRPAEHNVDESLSQIMEESVEVVKTVFLERISERICEQSGVIEEPKISIQEQILQSTREQFLDVPVPRFSQARFARSFVEKYTDRNSLSRLRLKRWRG